MQVGITPPERRQSVRLQDGRMRVWCEWDPANGLPVLFCAGAGMSGYVGFGSKDLTVTGQRLLAVDRPGLGASDPRPVKTLLTWIVDIRQVMEAADLRHAAAVGFSQRAPFALALGWKDLVNAVAVVAGQDDFSHAALTRPLHPAIEGMVSSARRDAAGRIISLSRLPDPADGLTRGLLPGSWRLCERPVNAMGTWPFQLEDIAVPVDLWYGALDTSIAHSPDFGATMASRLPDVWRELDFSEGASILWTKSGEILERLRRNQTMRKR